MITAWAATILPMRAAMHQRRARRRRLQLPPPHPVAEAFAAPNPDHLRARRSVQIGLKVSFFTGDATRSGDLSRGGRLPLFRAGFASGCWQTTGPTTPQAAPSPA